MPAGHKPYKIPFTVTRLQKTSWLEEDHLVLGLLILYLKKPVKVAVYIIRRTIVIVNTFVTCRHCGKEFQSWKQEPFCSDKCATECN